MKKTLVILMLALTVTSYAQKIKLLEGDLSPLKGQKAVKIEFTYDNMTVTKDDKTEESFIKERKEEYNKKEAGKGDKWAQSWVDDRQSRFEPPFREMFSKTSAMTTTDESAKYTLIFKTTHTELGYNIGISKRPAYIDGEAWIVESASKDKIIAKLSVQNIPGTQYGGFDFDTGVRLAECYEKAGKDIGKFIVKSTK
jgi:hypothetical protein